MDYIHDGNGIHPLYSHRQCSCAAPGPGIMAGRQGTSSVPSTSRHSTYGVFPKKITRLLWGGYFLSSLVMTSMMLLTCVKAIRKFRPLHLLPRKPVEAISSWCYLVPDHKDVRSDYKGAISRGHLGCLSTYDFAVVSACELTN